ncbi:hypothetical protein [Duganella sp. HH101]|uniref:hypothetical protein n=1 Tax=Duganella sp. HH101 TaxID=1781066 RepID=UPI000875069A|nr:hypothetical protein [Duganella sp. HH101]OFA00187.1 hypothetical protein DUGA2_50200 [Duganella sp. HH101]
MLKLTEIWHFHRPALAKVYLDTLNAGLVTSTTIFAPRRAGKTSFLLKDLWPAAEKAGYTVAYADLWQTRLSPGLAIVRALEQAQEPKGPLRGLMAKARAPVRKIKGKAEVAGAKLEGEVELGEGGSKAQSETALQIDVLIESLCRKAPLLLLIDEAQELARTREHEAVATALRTAITKNQQRLRVLFTGSSRTKLAHVFSNASAPLYSTGAAIADFPQLGRDFVEYIAQRYEESTRRTLPVAPAWKAFVAFHQQPEPFLVGVVQMVLNPRLALEEAMAAVADNLARTENHEGVWAGFDALQKALVKLLVDDPALKPFSKPVLLKLRGAVGVESLAATHVQRAMQKLSGVVVKSPRDTYEFENEAFAEWVRTLADG